MIKVKDFTDNYERSNLAAHKASQFVPKLEIESILKYASLFMIFTNELLGNQELQKKIDGEK